MNQTVLITGSSSGLGRAAVHYFHAQGWNVVATMRQPENETELTQLDRVLVTRLDLLAPESIGPAIQAGIDRFGAIDALVNNAGYGVFGPLEAIPPEKIRRQFDVNVLGMLTTIQALVPHFRLRGKGVIVNVSSIGGRMAFPLGALYHGSKFAVEGLSESLYYELGLLGIRVKIVEPGGMRTDFAGRSMDYNNDDALVDYQPLVQAVHNVLGPMMEHGAAPEQVARIVFEAATDLSPRLRHEAGQDAVQLIASRNASDDAHFLAQMKAMFGIAA